MFSAFCWFSQWREEKTVKAILKENDILSATQKYYQVILSEIKDENIKQQRNLPSSNREKVSNKTNKLCSANYLVEKLQMS